MHIQDTERKLTYRKKKIMEAAGIFFGIMLLLTFFSKSVHSWTLPKVQAGNVHTGSLTKEITGEGIVEAKGRIEYYTDLSVTVQDVLVSVGEEARRGEVLFLLDKEALIHELEREKLELAELKLQHEQLRIEKDADTGQQQLDGLAEGLRHKEKEYLGYKVLYEKGAESESSFEAKKYEYEMARLAYEKAAKELATETGKRNKEIAIKDVNISLKEVEIKETERELSQCAITAMSDGVIKEINFKRGMVLNNSLPVYVLDDTGEGFEFKADLAVEQCDYLKPGDEAKIFIKSNGNAEYSGKVKAVKDKKEDVNKKTVVIDMDMAELQGGEAGEFYLRKDIGAYDYLLPRSAIHKSSGGDCVYILKEKDGPLGKEYYAVEQKVTAGDSDYSFTGIYSGLLGDEKVISTSSKDLYDGCQVIFEK